MMGLSINPCCICGEEPIVHVRQYYHNKDGTQYLFFRATVDCQYCQQDNLVVVERTQLEGLLTQAAQAWNISNPYAP